MTLRLIFNADDYGLTVGVCRGIRQAHLRGVVTSTSCMIGMPGVGAEIKTARRECPRLGMGLHLTITAGWPILSPEEIPALCAADGRFQRLESLLHRRHALPLAQVEAEWRAQIRAFIEAAGSPPTHLDSHHHSSYFTPDLFRLQLKLAAEFGTAVRLPVISREPYQAAGLPPEVTAELEAALPGLLAEFHPRCPDGFLADFYETGATRQTLMDFTDSHPTGTWEVMCHPAYADGDLLAVSSYNANRQVELELLTNPQTVKALREKKVQLVNFLDVKL
jgi:predicted glycoside hydrolase/deacetylase ChbG (UPF0249 family)